MRAILAAIAFALAACGVGGGPSASGPITPAPALRSDLLFGYYYSNSSTVNETFRHVNLHWASDEFGISEQMAGLAQARANGQLVVVQMPVYNAPLQDREAFVRYWLGTLRNAGLLWSGIVAVYPTDEPDVWGKSDAEVVATNAAVRRALADFHEIDPAVAVFYACASGQRPGLATYDWIGCDDYGVGCRVVGPSGAYDDLLRVMTPAQRLVAIPGGADPWRQDPACFAAYAHREPRVVALVGFLWQSISPMVGIRVNGLKPLYCETGAIIVGANPMEVC